MGGTRILGVCCADTVSASHERRALYEYLLEPADLWFYAGLIGFVFARAYAVIQRESNPILLHGLSWFGIGIAPFCIMMNYQGLAERFAYFAAIGMVGAIVAVCLQANHPKIRKALTVCVTVWSLWNFYRTAVRATDWPDEVRLYRSSLAATPESPTVHFNLGFSLRERGELQEALTEYQKAINIDKHFPNGYASLGDVYLRLNSYPEAFGCVQAGPRTESQGHRRPTQGWGHVSGQSLYERGRSCIYQKVHQIDPRISAAHVDLGVLYLAELEASDHALSCPARPFSGGESTPGYAKMDAIWRLVLSL